MVPTAPDPEHCLEEIRMCLYSVRVHIVQQNSIIVEGQKSSKSCCIHRPQTSRVHISYTHTWGGGDSRLLSQAFRERTLQLSRNKWQLQYCKSEICMFHHLANFVYIPRSTYQTPSNSHQVHTVLVLSNNFYLYFLC